MNISLVLSTAKRYRGVVAVVLVVLSYPMAVGGRTILDQFIADAPAYAALIERIGGWLLGTVIAIVAVLPLAWLWDLIKSK